MGARAETSTAPGRWRETLRDRQSAFLVAVAGIGLATGTALWWQGRADLSAFAWAAATLPVLAALFWQIASSLARGDVGLDIVAALSMSVALLFGEPLAANVVALMYAGGQLLEAFAQGRARREMTALMGRVARTAMRHEDGRLREVPLEDVAPGDRLLIRQGEVLPVDGRLASPVAVLDLSALTGESAPKTLRAGDEALSGSVCLASPFDLLATRPAAESTYAGIVRLVAAAERQRAPMTRLADRYAIWFLALTLVIAGATWFLTGDRIRVLSVLVTATPCPLILAVPVALMSGMSRAAGIGVLVKGGQVLEALAGIRVVVLDKTGTLTHGEAAIRSIAAAPGFGDNEILRLAASLDQASGHVVADALKTAAKERGLVLATPENGQETPGLGMEGMVGGRRIVIGGLDFVTDRGITVEHADPLAVLAVDAMHVAVGVDGRLAGMILLEDRVRDDAAELLRAFRPEGVEHIVVASGDRADVARRVGEALKVDRVHGDLSPEHKVDVVRQARALGPVMMVGDGVNDAPALASADVGVAMGARGTASSSEAAGVVLLVDRLAPLVRAIAAARRSRRIALESVVVGLSLSLAAMIAAAFGWLQPVEGALVQEAIDVAVILNALRALR
jgi:heavy metal translocating P-type ATPase